MSTGALIFAYNNEAIDYESMAAWSATNIERHLGIPTHIVTGPSDSKNSRHFQDVGTVTWHNMNRMDAYKLSPWDTTLVLDADYVVASNQLSVLLESNQDFLAHRWAFDVTGLNDFSGLNYFGNYRMPQWWATVMMFRKSQQAELIFECMTMIRDNWKHFKNLYSNPSGSYRNDHALSIALGMVKGHWPEHDSIPWSLASVTPEHRLSQTSMDNYRVDFVTADKKNRWISLNGQDFHAMGKKQLGDIVANYA